MMPDQYTREYYFDGGVNNSLADELIADNELSDARNVHPKITGDGNLIKRCGTKAVSTGASYSGVTSYISRPSVYCGQNGNYFTECFQKTTPYTFNIYKVSDGTVLYTDTSAVLQYPAWASYGSYDIYADGTRAVKTTNGTAFTAVANFPTGGHSIVSYNNYLFCLVGNTLRWSGANDCETWDATHALNFVLSDKSDELSATGVLDDKLIVFSSKRFFPVQGFGPLDFTITGKNLAAGCPTSILVQSTPYGLFWWSPMHGLSWTKDGVTVDFPMLRKLRKTFNAYDYTTSIYGSIIWRPEYQCVSMYMNSDSGSSTNAALRADYYPMRDAFYLHDGATAQVAAAGTDDGITTTLFAGTSVYIVKFVIDDKLYCRQEDETLSADLSTPYTAYIKTKRRSDPLKSAWKNVKSVFVTTKFPSTGAMTYQIMADNQTTANQTMTLTQSAGMNDNYLSINQKHRKIQHYLSDGLDQRTEYFSIVETGTVDKIV